MGSRDKKPPVTFTPDETWPLVPPPAGRIARALGPDTAFSRVLHDRAQDRKRKAPDTARVEDQEKK